MNQFEYQPQIKLFKGYLPTKPVASGHSSVDTSAPTLLRPQVRIPCTPSTLFQFIVELCEQAQIFFFKSIPRFFCSQSCSCRNLIPTINENGYCLHLADWRVCKHRWRDPNDIIGTFQFYRWCAAQSCWCKYQNVRWIKLCYGLTTGRP